MSGDRWVVDDDHTAEMFIQFVKSQVKAGRPLEFRWSSADTRSNKQNNAMWLWLEFLSIALNDAGLDMRKMLKPSISIPWTKDLAKAYLWNPIQEALTKKKSSTKLSKDEFAIVHETLARHLAESKGIAVPFPTRERIDAQKTENPS